ncbi:MAG: hypothetical protein WBD48_02200 [Pseudolabrys sp.]
MSRVVKTILHPDGKRRVIIILRDDALFSYEVEELKLAYDAELAEQLQDFRTVWTPVRHDLTICQSQEDAEREARGAISWLKDI